MTTIMEAFRVAVAFLLVQTLFMCLHLHTQLMHHVDDQRRMRARRSAILPLLPPIQRPSCRFWVRPGWTAVWWDHFENEVVVLEEWHENFRMSRSSLLVLSDLLRPYIEDEISFPSSSTLLCSKRTTRVHEPRFGPHDADHHRKDSTDAPTCPHASLVSTLLTKSVNKLPRAAHRVCQLIVISYDKLPGRAVKSISWFGYKLAIFSQVFPSDMTPPPKDQKVAECLNRLHAINLGEIASNCDITAFIIDYFVKDEDEDDHDSVLDEADEKYEDSELNGGADTETPVMVIEPQASSLADLKRQIQHEDFASNAGSPEVKLQKGFSCTCKYFNGKQCSSSFKEEELLKSEAIYTVGKKQSIKKRHHRQPVNVIIWITFVKDRKSAVTLSCTDIDVFKDRLAALLKHYLENGVTQRTHGNKGKLPKHALEVNDIERVVTFIHNYAEENAVLLHGRIPGYKRDDLKLLPSSVSKAAIHKLYRDSCEASGHRAASKRTFYRLWQQYVPNVLPMKAMSDLCWTCQKNSALLIRASKQDLREKTTALAKAEEHLLQATTEHSYYNCKVQECRQVLAENGITKLMAPGNTAPHASHDFERLLSINLLHHIECRVDGSVICKTLAQSEPVTHKLLKCNLDNVPVKKPIALQPEGLSDDRERYLLKEIRRFVAEQYRDVVCPNRATEECVADVNNNDVCAETSSGVFRVCVYECPDFSGQMMERTEDLSNLLDHWHLHKVHSAQNDLSVNKADRSAGRRSKSSAKPVDKEAQLADDSVGFATACWCEESGIGEDDSRAARLLHTVDATVQPRRILEPTGRLV
ncbi:hypothetical protein D9C73_000829 [Collichthys lucidus]|uniref:Uncharacterized protein n=1 Tax=Collichthys lucidus TaxID=240159 RepID=A0A4U5U1B1_COLLU|nr:hypothetical protein D9C73_000829 [Collichthys lucidus]